jgi:hypothetical protein
MIARPGGDTGEIPVSSDHRQNLLLFRLGGNRLASGPPGYAWVRYGPDRWR